MTREEAIKRIDEQYKICEEFYYLSANPEKDFPGVMSYMEALAVAISALRPVSREQVEQVWRSYWDGFSNGYADDYEVYDEWQCRKCGFEVETDGPETLPQFCPACGAPMTDEAVDILLKRLEAQKDELSRLQAP